MKSFVIILLTVFLALPLSAQSKFAGHWNGKLAIGSVSLTIVFNVTGIDDSLNATLDSPDQGATGIPVKSVSVKGDSIYFDIQRIGGSYYAQYNQEGDSVFLKGVFSQAGQKFELICGKTDKVFTFNRPQEPKPPFPYLTEEVEFENKSAGIKFSGTFTRPEKGNKFPAVVMVTGSGPQDRDENIFGHKPFAVIADHLTRNGFAVLRYDERGVGKSTGTYATATTHDFMLDALEAVRYLKSRKDVDKNKTGIIGHSEGGVVAPMAASVSQDVNFIVMMAGLGINGRELLILQTKAVLEAESVPANIIDKQLIFSKELYDIILTHQDSASFFEAGEDLITEFTQILTDEEKAFPEFSKDNLSASLKIADTKWFRYFLATDPAEYLPKVKVPVLAINGTKDIQVPYSENLSAIENLLKKGGNSHYHTEQLDGLNHLFQHCDKCSVGEYGKIEETFNTKALDVITEWLKKIVK